MAPDKYRGSLTAPQVVEAVAAAARAAGGAGGGRPMADGGAGSLDAFGGPNRTLVVTGPHGRPVEAGWRHDGELAVIESALASGLALAGGSEGNDPRAATSRGTGELIGEAVLAGATRIVVGLGGSAMTDGGLAAVEAILASLGGRRPADLGVQILVACDVQTVFTDAAAVFGPQKGATPEDVVALTSRLHEVQRHYEDRFGQGMHEQGVDLTTVPGAGAAGGLGGGLVALGGQLMPGFDLVAEQVGLGAALAAVDAVVTGEGALDTESFNGKVVGGVVAAALDHDLPVLILAGTVRPDAPEVPARVTVVDLSARFGEQASWHETARCLGAAVEAHLATLGDPRAR